MMVNKNSNDAQKALLREAAERHNAMRGLRKTRQRKEVQVLIVESRGAIASIKKVLVSDLGTMTGEQFDATVEHMSEQVRANNIEEAKEL